MRQLFFQRLVSGEALFTKALGQISRKQNEKAIVDQWFENALEEGFVITIGEPDIHAALANSKLVEISVPITVKASPTLKTSLTKTAKLLGGTAKESFLNPHFPSSIEKAHMARVGADLEIVMRLQKRVASMVFLLELVLNDDSIQGCYVSPDFHMFGSQDYPGGFPLIPIYSLLAGNVGVSDTSEKLHADEGFIAVFEEPIAFTVATDLHLNDAKKVRTVRGRVSEGTLDHERPTLSGTNSCRIKR